MSVQLLEEECKSLKNGAGMHVSVPRKVSRFPSLSSIKKTESVFQFGFSVRLQIEVEITLWALQSNLYCHWPDHANSSLLKRTTPENPQKWYPLLVTELFTVFSLREWLFGILTNVISFSGYSFKWQALNSTKVAIITYPKCFFFQLISPGPYWNLFLHVLVWHFYTDARVLALTNSSSERLPRRYIKELEVCQPKHLRTIQR